MKKLILMLSVCLTVVMVSCKETNKKTDADADTEMQLEHAADQADMALNVEYQCPMDCEEGKTYEIAGTCPVCGMDLKEVEKEEEHADDNDESHTEDHDTEEDHDSDEDHI